MPILFFSEILASINLLELSLKVPNLKLLLSVGVTYTVRTPFSTVVFVSSKVNFGNSLSPAFVVAVFTSLSKLPVASVVTALAVTLVASLTSRSLIVTTPVFSLIVTPSVGCPLKVHLLFTFVAVTVWTVGFSLLAFVYLNSNLLTLSSVAGVIVTSPFVGVIVGAVGFIWTSIFLYKYERFTSSETLSPVTPLAGTFSTPFVDALLTGK